jgi:hypothetical protein
MEKSPQPKQKLELDLSTDEWTERLGGAPVFAKKGKVQARQVAEREEVRTTLADGTEETVNVAEPGDVVVTNPGGEKYVLKPDNFGKRYEATEEEGVFRAKGMARAVANPTGADIEIMAPWGEPQYGGPDCMVATVFDPDQPDVIGGDRYIIGGEEFAATYAPFEEVYGPQTAQQPEQPAQ